MNPEKAFVKEVLEQPEWNVALAEHAETLERNPRDFRAWEAIGDLYTEAGVASFGRAPNFGGGQQRWL